MNKTDVLETLGVLGFDVEEIPEFGFLFKYEVLTLVFMPDNDENALRFVVPNIFDVTEENRAFVLDVVNGTNLTIKYSKVCIYGDQVWAFYECRLFGEGQLEDIIEHCLLLLQATVALFHRKIEGEDFDAGNDDNDEKEGGE